MAFSSLLSGVMLILVIFNIGELSIKKLHFNRIFLIIILSAIFITSFISPIFISNWQLSFAGFIIPLIISIYYLFKVGSLYSFLRVGVSILLVTTLTLIYNVISFESFEYMYLQPYMLLALVLGFSVFYIARTISNGLLSFFLGFSLANVIYYLTKNMNYDYSNIILGDEQMLTMFLLATFSCMLGYYVYRRVKLLKKRKASAKQREAEI